jgi:hypothetical protein
MAEKDAWEKFEIFTKFFGAVILVAIPIVIKYGADNIAQSLERGKLIQSLLGDLTQHEAQARRDIALVALDAAAPPKQECAILGLWGCHADPNHDQVVNVAIILLHDLIQGEAKQKNAKLESTTAKDIIIRRTSEAFFAKKFEELSRNAQQSATSSVDLHSTQSVAERKTNASEILQNIQPRPQEKKLDQRLPGVRLVYLQYRSNRDQAQKLQQYLRDSGVSAPGIEQVRNIAKNDIRYPNDADQELAEHLRVQLEKNLGITIDQLINLSEAGYKVPSGQFEIWLKE